MTELSTPTKHWSQRFLLPLRRKRNFNEFRKGLVRSPRIIDMPLDQGLPDGMIAVWGDVVLTPVDADNIKKLADGRSPKLGFMVDFVADFERSAKKGLPVYKIGGGPGLVLAVSYGKPDRGTLRLIAVDASKFASPATIRLRLPLLPTIPTQDQAVIAAQPSPTPDRTATVAQSSLQPTSTSNELQTNITDLKHTISLLKGRLGKCDYKNHKTRNSKHRDRTAAKARSAGKINC